MNNKYIFIAVSLVLLSISVWWGVSGNSFLEPWTAVLSAILALLGFILPVDAATKSPETEISQTNILSSSNSSVAKKIIGKIKQLNIGSFGNNQKVED